MDYPALVNSILENDEEQRQEQRGPCGICNQRHPTIRCFLLRTGNIPRVLQRRIEQFRLKLKSEIEKLDKQDEERGHNAKVLPPPPKASVSFNKPTVSTISSEVAQDFHNQVDQTTSALQDVSQEPHELSSQEKVDIQHLSTLLENTVGDTQPATPIPPVVAAASTQQDLLVDFNQDESNYIPIHADYESELNQSHYDAYNDTVNW